MTAADSHTDTKGGDAKAASKPAPIKRPRLDDDEDANPPAAPLKQKMLSTGLSRAIVLSTIVLALAFVTVGLLGDRYAISPVPNSPNSFVYRVDRLTGAIHFCGSQQCSVVRINAAE
jgi:hypothetical protein